MKAGSLRTPLTLRKPTTGEDALGQPVTGMVDVGPDFGDVRHLSGAQAIKAGGEASTVKASIRLRHREDVTAAWQVSANGLTYRVQAVMPDPRRVFVDLVCEVIT